MNSTLIASYSIIVLYCVLALTGLVGNAWVMLTVIGQLLGYGKRGGGEVANKDGRFHHHHRRRCAVAPVQFSACIYLLLLSVVDLVSFVPVPLLAADIIENRWPFGLALCKLLYACEGANKSLSPLVLTALSVDRYMAVCLPALVWLRQSRFALAVIAVCTVISSLFIAPVTWRATVSQMADQQLREHRKCVVEMDQTYDIFHTAACYVLPLTFICSVYIAILRRLYRHTRISAVGRRTSISLSRVVKCSMLVVAFYFICWTPYWAMRITSILSTDGALPPIVDDAMTHADPLIGTITIAAPSLANDDGSANITALLALLRKWRSGADSGMPSHIAPSNISALLQALGGAPTPALYDEPLGEQDDFLHIVIEDYRHILLMYLVHALPYTQSAFNWLFYAFLNRNLRQSTRFGAHAQNIVTTGGDAPAPPPADAPTPASCRHSPSSTTAYYSSRGSMIAGVPAIEKLILSFWRRLIFWRWSTRDRGKASGAMTNTTVRGAPFLHAPKQYNSKANGYKSVIALTPENNGVLYSSSAYAFTTPNPTETSTLRPTAPNSPATANRVNGGLPASPVIVSPPLYESVTNGHVVFEAPETSPSLLLPPSQMAE